MTSLIGLVLGISVALLKSGSDLCGKYSMNNDINEYVSGWALRFFALPFLLFLTLLGGGIPDIDPEFWPVIAGSGAISVTATVLYMKAFKLSDASLMSPLKSLSPMLLLITSPIMVGEFPSPLGLVGVMTILVGVYTLNITERSAGWMEPFKALITEPGAKFMAAVLILYSISANLDKIGTEASNPLFYTLMLHVLAVAGLTPLMVIKTDDWATEVRENAKYIAPIGMFNGLASVVYMFALTYTLVIYVSALKRMTALTTVIGATLLLSEGGLRERLPGACIIICGVILITLSLT